MIIPVFDLKDNIAVGGKSGKRSSYNKLKSVYGDDLLSICQKLVHDGFRYVYIADLDMIEGCGSNLKSVSRINEIIPVILDCGCCDIEGYEKYKNISTYSILATETMDSIAEAKELLEYDKSKRIIISIDIKNNELLIKNNDITIDDVINLVNDTKPDYSIILNISQVGTNTVSKSSPVEDIICKTPYTQHILGGGITGESIPYYNSIGIDNFLIGTQLHEGKLPRKYYPVKK